MSERVPAGYAEVHFRFHLASDPETMITSLGFDVSGDPELPDLETAVTTAHEALGNLMTEAWTVGPSQYVLGQAGDEDVIIDMGEVKEGQVSGESVPQNCCYLVRKSSYTPGRRGRGRMFIPGVPASYVLANGMLTSPAQSALAENIDELLLAFTLVGGILFPVLFHQSAPFAPSQIGALTGQTQIATQRRRMRP